MVRAAELLSEEPDLRRGLCVAARALAGADLAVLWEPRGDGLVEPTATSAAFPLSGGMLVRADRTTVPGLVLTERREVRVPDTTVSDIVVREVVEPLGLKSLLGVPVTRHGAAIGALVVYWRQHLGTVDPHGGECLELLAAAGGAGLQALQRAARLEHLALTDPLTGLPNRRALEAHLEREVARAGRRRMPLAVAVLDLDGLKETNDRDGHEAGDALLREAATGWRTQLRAGDLLARVGGDEFVLVLPDCDTGGDWWVTVDRVREAAPVASSAGVARWDGEEAPSELLLRADRALYEAKREGGARTRAA